MTHFSSFHTICMPKLCRVIISPVANLLALGSGMCLLFHLLFKMYYGAMAAGNQNSLGLGFLSALMLATLLRFKIREDLKFHDAYLPFTVRAQNPITSKY